jgi:predicted AAA+ superfamily ATPase
MSIEELEDRHGNIPLEPLNFDEFHYKKHAKTSVEFAISVLESIDMSLHLNSEAIYSKRQQKFIEDKIKELKQYLNE